MGEPSTMPPEFGEVIMQFNESMVPIIEWAEGQKQMLVQRGWDVGSADRYGCELLLGWTRMLLSRMTSS